MSPRESKAAQEGHKENQILSIFIGAVRDEKLARKLAAQFSKRYGEAAVAQSLELRNKSLNRTTREGRISSGADVAAATLPGGKGAGMQKQLYQEIDKLSRTTGMSIEQATEAVIRAHGGDPARALSGETMQSLGMMDADWQAQNSLGASQPGYVVNQEWNNAMNAVFGTQQQSSSPGYNMTHRSGSDVLMVDGKFVAASDPQAVMAWEYNHAIEKSKPQLQRAFEKWKADPNSVRKYHGEPDYFAPDEGIRDIVPSLPDISAPESVNDLVTLIAGGLTGYHENFEQMAGLMAPLMAGANPIMPIMMAPSYLSHAFTGKSLSRNIGNLMMLDSGYSNNRDLFRNAQTYGSLYATGVQLAASPMRGLSSLPLASRSMLLRHTIGAGISTMGGAAFGAMDPDIGPVRGGLVGLGAYTGLQLGRRFAINSLKAGDTGQQVFAAIGSGFGGFFTDIGIQKVRTPHTPINYDEATIAGLSSSAGTLVAPLARRVLSKGVATWTRPWGRAMPAFGRQTAQTVPLYPVISEALVEEIISGAQGGIIGTIHSWTKDGN